MSPLSKNDFATFGKIELLFIPDCWFLDTGHLKQPRSGDQKVSKSVCMQLLKIHFDSAYVIQS